MARAILLLFAVASAASEDVLRVPAVLETEDDDGGDNEEEDQFCGDINLFLDNCAEDEYCNGFVLGSCEPKKENGKKCQGNYECLSGKCSYKFEFFFFRLYEFCEERDW